VVLIVRRGFSKKLAGERQVH